MKNITVTVLLDGVPMGRIRVPVDAEEPEYARKAVALKGVKEKLRDRGIAATARGDGSYKMFTKVPARIRRLAAAASDAPLTISPFHGLGVPHRWNGRPRWSSRQDREKNT